MVVNRSDYKRRRKDEPDALPESPKRTKVHAQRKFAQGSSSVTSPTLTPVKDKVKVNGSAPPAELLPAKRPHTEDFLTFLCFRGTKILPPRLNFFNTASVPESPADDISSAAGSSSNAKQKKNSDQAPSTSDVDRGRNKTKPASAQDRAAKALRKKYQEQRLAKQKKTCLTKLTNETVKEDRLSKTRSSARAAELDKKRKRNARIMAYNKARKAAAVVTSKPAAPAAVALAKPIVKRTLKQKQLRVGLRSGGQLPPGSDLGLKNPVRRTKTAPAPPSKKHSTNDKESDKNEKHSRSPQRRTVRGNSKQIASSLSDFSSEDEQPLVKKKNAAQARQQTKARSPTIRERLGRSRQQHSTASTSGVTNRPSRKTKEAAALYMEMLGKDLRSPDEHFEDDEVSVESFPELPNKKKTELRERELKALAEKGHSTKDETKTRKSMKPTASTSRAQKVIAKRVRERNRRLQLRNKAKGKYLQERKKKEAMRKRRIILLARAAKQRAGKVYRERSSSEVESSSPSKSTSPVRGIDSRRSSLALKQAAEALKQAAEKLSELSPRKLSSSPEKSPVRVSPEKAVPKKKLQFSPERSPANKRLTNDKKATSSKNAGDKNQSAQQQKKAAGKNASKNETNNSSDKSVVKDNQPSTASLKKQSVEKNVNDKKPVEQSNKKSFNTTKSSDKEEVEETSAPAKKTGNVSKNVRSSSVSKEKKSSTTMDEEKSDHFGESDEEPLTKLTKKITKKEEESVTASKMAAPAAKTEANSDKNDSQTKPPKQRKQKSPQKKLVDTVSDKTSAFVSTKVVSAELNSSRSQLQISGSDRTEVERNSESSTKNIPVENKKEENKNETNVESTSDGKLMKTSCDGVQNKTEIKEVEKGNEKVESKKVSSDQGKMASKASNVTESTVEVLPIKAGNYNPPASSSKSTGKSIIQPESSIKLTGNVNESPASSSLDKSIVNSSKGSSNEVKNETENKVQTQLKVEKCLIADRGSLASTTQFVDTFQSTKNVKIEKISSFDEFPTDKTKQVNKEAVQSYKNIKLEKSSSLDEVEMKKKSLNDLSPSAKQLKTETSTVVDESALNKKDFKDSLQAMKVEKSLKSEETPAKRKIDLTQSAKSLQVEKTTSTSDEFKTNKTSCPSQTIDETKIEAKLKYCASGKDTSGSKKNTESVSFLPIKMPTTSNEGFTSLSVAPSQKVIQKQNTPLFISTDTQVTESPPNIFEAAKCKPNTNSNSSSTAFKSTSMAVPKTKPGKEDGTLGKLHSKQMVNPEIKSVSKDVPQNKTILSVPKINLDRNSGGVVDKAKKVVSSVDFQASSMCGISGQMSGVLEKNNRLESNKLGGEQLAKELNVPKRLDTPSPTKTPVKLTHVLPAACPVNPQNTMKPISRPGVEVKKTKSVNDTWRQAFKNAKIPKPGQSSPVMTDEKPFVRKPFTSHAMKKQIQFDGKCDASTSSQRVEVASGSNSSMNPITPFAVNRKPFAITSTPPLTPSNVATNSNVNPVLAASNVASNSNVNPVLAATNSNMNPVLTSTNVATTCNVIPVVTVTMSTKNSVVSIPIPAATKEDATRAQRTVDPDELRLKEAELVEDIVRMYGVDYEGVHKNLSIGSVKKSDVKPLPTQILPQTTFNTSTTTERGKQIITFTAKIDNQEPPPLSPVVKNDVENVQTPPIKTIPESSSAGNEQSSSLSPAKPASPMRDDKPKGPGKHHNLPLPVEQTLKKLQTKSLVTKKPPPLQKTFQDLRKQQQQQNNVDKNVSLTSSRTIDSNVSPFLSDFPSSSGLLNKKKVNMSTEEIKKWLNDSTSTGIEHTKDCGIFEKNQCECGPSFGDDKTSPLTSEPSSPVITEDPNKTLKVSDQKVASVSMEAGLSKSMLVVAVDKKQQPEKTVSEPETKTMGTVFKQQNSSPQPAAAATFVKSLDSPQKSSPVLECKSAFVGGSLISNRGKFERTPTKEDDKLKLSIDGGEGRKPKSDAQSSPSAQFSPPMAVSQLHHRDETSSNDDSPEKSSSSSVQHERRSIFHQKRSVFRSRPSLSRSPSAFSPENESSVYAFEPDLPPTSTPFRASRAKGGNKEGRTSNATTDDEDAGLSSNSIAVQVNIDSEEVLECSTQTDDDDGEGGHLFYIPIQRNCNSENVVGSGSGQQVIQGVAVKLGTEGPDQRVIMSAKLVTKPRSTFASTSTPRPLIGRGESIGVSCKPEQKVKPLTMSSPHAAKPPVGTVQPTARVTATQETVTKQQKSEDAADTRSSNAEKDAKNAKHVKSNSKNADPVKKIDKEIPAADFDRPSKSGGKSSDNDTAPVKSSTITAKNSASTAKNSTATADQEKGSQCDERSLTNSPSPSPTPPPVDRRRKAAVTSSYASLAERGRKTTAAVRKQSPAPFLGKKSRKSSPSLKDSAAGSSDGQMAGPSSKAKRSKGRGVGTPDNSSIQPGANLEEAPVFYPTEKEFLDPLEYIEKIRPVAEKYGICKVIPPADFKPECKVSDDMRFTAYNQYVHKMQQRWGPNVKEMLAIRRHLATQSISMSQPPWIGGMEVDLPRLYQTVQNCGGLREVMEKKRWTRVADAMRIPKFAQDRVTKLDDIYCKFLLPYDTLSHDERTKLFQSVELEWERRMLKNDDYYDDDEDDDSDSDDSCNLEECIVKGKTMALSAFYRVARNTMAVHFPKNDSPSATEVESEFWSHVASRQSHVCVHSGSIDSGAFGYGFPIVKNSATSKHPWNLKVLTNNSGTILRSLGPLMGVTVPTLHVGMVFAACCWYRDPHGLPWIEYLHTGKSKIWYGIPDASSGAFRAAMMECVPRLCRDKSIWLASDTAMVSPHLLATRGVQLCRTVQQPGQFIIVFPKAFTSSICTGYLVSESVYFAQPSWLATAHTVFKDISDSSEPSMFSLERLLFSIASDARSHLDVLSQVLPMVEEIKESELNQRFELEKLGLTQTERIMLSKARGKSRLAHDEDGDYECDTCRANLFLSLVKNTHDDCVYCLKHAIEHLKGKPGDLKHYSLLYTYNGEEFDELIEKIKTRIEQKSQKKQQGKPSTASSSSSKADQH